MTEPRKLERGMLLLDPETYSTPHLWTVATTGLKSAKVIAHYGSMYAEARLRTGYVPEGWTLIDHNAAAEALTALSSRGPRPSDPQPTPDAAGLRAKEQHRDG